MSGFLVAVGLLLAGGLLAAAFGRRSPGLAHRVGQAGAVAGAAIGLLAAIRSLLLGERANLLLPWSMPGGGVHLGIDILSAFFLLPVFGLALLCAVYGRTYLTHHAATRNPGSLWLHFNLLVLGMALVVTARDGLLFLLAWEVLALSPFFLVGYEDEKAGSRHAAWIYLIATHLGTGFLLVMFVLLGQLAGGSDFAGYAPALAARPELVPLVFVLALIGFGSKAGFVPTHVWLPEAHPAAPSHASALMSGVMIKTGIYGLVRTMTLLGAPQAWWGWVLIAIGASSGILGVVFALAQHDLKRLLAYHSVENIGIIMLGLGVGTLGLAAGSPLLATLGYAGGLLHVINHSIFKGLLFLGAGAVQSSTHTLALEQLGGLLKRMPRSGFAFLVGAVAIVGLPPLNGFVSEFLIFVSGFLAVAEGSGRMAAGGASTLVALALISGLAGACFAKVVGVVYLGEPRSAAAGAAQEVPRAMRGSMLVLAALCVLIGLGGPLLLAHLGPLVSEVTGVGIATTDQALLPMARALAFAVAIFVALAVLASGLWRWRTRRLALQGVRSAPTWGCGYSAPNPRMQYTASSFADPLNRQFGALMHVSREIEMPRGLFPGAARLETESDDPFHHLLFAPTFRWLDRLLNRAEIIQRGHTHIYVLYVAATLLVVLIFSILTL